MKEILLVAAQELIVNLRRPGYIIMTLLIPALGLVALVAGSIFGGEIDTFLETQFVPQQKAIGYVDQSGLLAAPLPQYAGQYVPYPDEPTARAALVADEITSYFFLSADYLQTGKVVFYGTGGGFSTFVAADEGGVRSFLLAHLLAGRLDPAIQSRALAPMDVQAVTLDETGEVSTESPFSWLGDFVIPYVFSILFVITLFSTSGFLLQSVSEEKEGRIMEILLSSINSTQLMAGKILGLGTVGVIQVAIWFGAGAALLIAATAMFALVGTINITLGSALLALLYAGLGYVLYATLMAVAGSMGTTMRESQQIAGIFTFAAAIPWIAIGFMFSNPNSPLAVALSYIPLTAPVMMLIRLGFGQIPTVQIITSLVLLVVSIAFSLWAGAKVFRVGLLMYGKRPSLRDLARAFQQA